MIQTAMVSDQQEGDEDAVSKKEKFYTCKYAKEVGEIAVYVEPTCPHGTKIKGTLVSSKQRCRSCSSYEKREVKK